MHRDAAQRVRAEVLVLDRGGIGDGAAHSAQSIRHRIKTLIAGENDVLSDDASVAALRREGCDLTRRAVAKYREPMRIPSSVERRRMRAPGRL